LAQLGEQESETIAKHRDQDVRALRPNNRRAGQFDALELLRTKRLIRWEDIFMQKQNDQIVETAVGARAGFLGRPVLVVLVVSCVLGVAVMTLTYLGAFKI
jgi:hypothetical protein